MEHLSERSSNFSFIASSLLICLMLACVVIGLVQFGSRLDSRWTGAYLPWWALFVALEAIYSTLVIRRLSYTGLDWLRMRLVEFVVLLLALKIMLLVLFVPMPEWLSAGTWRAVSVFDGSFWLGLVLTIIIWITASEFAEDLIQIYRTDSTRKNDIASLNAQDRMLARRRLVDKVLVLGALLITITAFSRIDLRLIWGDRAPADASYANLLLFFVFSLALFSQSQLATLSALWKIEEIPVRGNVFVRWLIASLLFLGVLAFLIWFIPTYYAGSLFQVLQVIIQFLISVIWTAWGLLGYLMVALFRLLGLPIFQAPEEQAATPPQRLVRPEAGPTLPSEWLEILKTVLFWGILLVVIGFSAYQYFQQNQELWPQLRRIPLLAWIGRVLLWFRDRLRGIRLAAQTTAGRIRTRLMPKGGPISNEKEWRFTNPGRLTPRQQVLFYYMATLQKGEQSGIRRGQGQTPHEYARALKEKIPESAEQLSPLTDSFVEARYSRHPIPDDQGIQARRWWQGLRKLLSRKKVGS